MSTEGKKENYLNCSKGIMSWLYTLDHKRIGLMYLVSAVAALIAGGLFAWLTLWRGNLLPAIVAHMLVNGVNLLRLMREYPAPEELS